MLEPEVIELRVSTVLDNGKAGLDAQHFTPPTPRRSAAVGCYRLRFPTGASRPPTGVPEVSPRLQLRLPPIDGSRASPRGSRRAGLAVPRAPLHLHEATQATHTCTPARLPTSPCLPRCIKTHPVSRRRHAPLYPLHLCSRAPSRPHATYSYSRTYSFLTSDANERAKLLLDRLDHVGAAGCGTSPHTQALARPL